MNQIFTFPTAADSASVRKLIYQSLGGYPPTGLVRQTRNYTGTQILGGFGGAVSTTKNAARIYGIASRTGWSGTVTGSDAVLTATADSAGSANGLVQVSVDGSAFREASRSGGNYTLFSGLSDSPHRVHWRWGTIFGNNPYVVAASNVLAVTGNNPSIVIPTNWYEVEDGSTATITSSATIAGVANYIPANFPGIISSTFGSNPPSIAIRGTFTRMNIITTGQYVGVSIDGALPTYYDLRGADQASRSVQLVGLSGLRTYYVFAVAGSSTSVLSVGVDAVADTLAIRERLDQYGDSITAGVSATSAIHTDVSPIAAFFGYTPGSYGVSGNTTAQLQARLATILAAKTVASGDAAIIAIGRNDTVFDATWETNYTDIINQLLTKGYGKVLCRGVLPEGANLWPTANTAIQGRVTAAANPNVFWIDPSGWSGIATSDGTHPTDAGYLQMVEYAKTSYLSALG